jgi:flavin reductase (DIM6/NTAB) family NADH-FMN oxidoreductase RutF
MASDLWEVFRRISQGVYVIGVSDGQIHKAFTAAWVMQVSFDPLLLALSINPRHSSYAVLKRGAVFSVNVLGAAQRDLAKHFGQPVPGRDKLAGIDWTVQATGAPVLAEALAYVECEVTAVYPAGDHQIAVGRVVRAELLDRDSAPLLYRDVSDIDGSESLFPKEL